MSFHKRWQIEGVLTTMTPLHIGCGETTKRTGLGSKEQPALIQAITTDAAGNPYIPGTTFKGNIRSWLTECGADPVLVKAIFGFGDEQTKEGQGGRAEFWDCPLLSGIKPVGHIPYWDPNRQTGVEASVVIDRATRTARDKKLFYNEYVPPGVAFRVVISGSGLDNAEIELLLAGLEGFNEKVPVTLGADTINDKGRLQWQLNQIKKMGRIELAEWLKQSPLPMWHSALKPIDTSQHH